MTLTWANNGYTYIGVCKFHSQAGKVTIQPHLACCAEECSKQCFIIFLELRGKRPSNQTHIAAIAAVSHGSEAFCIAYEANQTTPDGPYSFWFWYC